MLFIACGIMAFMASCAPIETKKQEIKSEDMKSEDRVTLTMLYSREDITWSLLMDDLCSKFESENPDIDIQLQEQGSGIYEENLKIKEALDDFPDIFEIQNTLSYVDNGNLGEIPAEVSDLIEAPQMIDEKIYSIPLYTTTYGVIYNQAVFKKYGLNIPKSYEEFQTVCETLKANGVSPIACGGTKSDSITYWLNYFYQKNFHGEKDGSFHFSEYKEMFEDYSKLMDSGYILKDSIYMNDSQVISAILSSDVAMYYSTPGFIANIMQADPNCISSDKDNYGEEIVDEPGTVRLSWFFIPQEKEEIIAVTEVGSRLAISKECQQDPHKYKAAGRFLKFLFEDENYRDILKTMYGFQTTKRRVLYPAPTVQQGLIINYRYAKKEESFRDSNHIYGSFRNELIQSLYQLAGKSLTAEETAQYLEEKWMELK